jgi:hypothetical protein
MSFRIIILSGLSLLGHLYQAVAFQIPAHRKALNVMRNYMKTLYTTLIILTTLSTIAQAQELETKSARPLEKRLIVKSNVLSLIARRPTVSIEKLLPNRLSTELCFVQGQFNNILFPDHYDYSGFLLRLKKYTDDFRFGEVNPFLGTYIGTLTRNIQTEGRTDNSGWFGYPSRYFSANSIRAGGTVGLTYFSKSKFVIEGLGSLGYGRYFNLNKSDPDTYSNGYLDLQIWLSVGYSF